MTALEQAATSTGRHSNNNKNKKRKVATTTKKNGTNIIDMVDFSVDACATTWLNKPQPYFSIDILITSVNTFFNCTRNAKKKKLLYLQHQQQQ